jgi:hypothetical protein
MSQTAISFATEESISRSRSHYWRCHTVGRVGTDMLYAYGKMDVTTGRVEDFLPVPANGNE